MGDEIQTMKAGLMEIADIFVINKANRAGAKQLQTELTSMLNLSPKTLTAGKPPIVIIGDAFKPDSFAEDIAQLRAKNRRASYISAAKAGKLTERMHRKGDAEIKDALAPAFWSRFWESLTVSGELEHFAEKIKSRKADPYSVAEEIHSTVF